MHEKSVCTLEPSSAAVVRPIDDFFDPRIQQIASLKERVQRENTGLFQIEGLRFLLQAAEQHFPLQSLVFTPSDLNHPIARRLVRQLIATGVPAMRVSSKVLHMLANREDPQGVIAVTKQRWQTLNMTAPATGLCWVAVDTIRSAGNLGTLLRTMDCVGCAGVILVGDSVDPYDPACVRSSTGAIFSQRIVRATFDELRTWANRYGAVIVGTSPRAKDDYHSARYARTTVLFIGSERKGLSNERQSQCDKVVRIPMVGRSDSLNLSVAASVVLYEIFQQRKIGGGTINHR